MKLILAIIICQLAGIVGSVFTYPAITTWYKNLNKPSFNPPNSIFGPVWITLYTLMGISLYLIYGKGVTDSNKTALIFFMLQLVLNSVWSIAFFGMQSPFLGLLIIIPLWILILLTIIYAYPVSKASALILIPYLLWVSFASILNFSIYRLNP
jgi:tryptophan-rich sensory protein